MIPKNDANICPLCEKTKPQALNDVNKKNPPYLKKARWINAQCFNSFQIIRFKGIS